MSTLSKITAQPSQMYDIAELRPDISIGRVLPLSWTESTWEPEVVTKLQARSNKPGRLIAVNGGNHAMSHKKGFTQRRGTMKAMILYDDVASAARAVAILRRCSSLARVRAQWDIKPWRVGILKLPLAAEEALIESLDTDVMVFAALRAHRLPKWLKEWLKCWSVRRQSRELALVITQGTRDARHYGFGDELLSFAAQNELDLIFEADPSVGDPLVSELVQPKTSFLLAATDEATIGAAATSHYSYRNWGINE